MEWIVVSYAEKWKTIIFYSFSSIYYEKAPHIYEKLCFIHEKLLKIIKKTSLSGWSSKPCNNMVKLFWLQFAKKVATRSHSSSARVLAWAKEIPPIWLSSIHSHSRPNNNFVSVLPPLFAYFHSHLWSSHLKLLHHSDPI